MASIRLVTKYPPTTLIVAKVTAIKPSQLTNIGELPVPAANKAPTKVIPDTALVPDINGVCKVGGTLVISSTPRNKARTNNAKSKIKVSIDYLSWFSSVAARGAAGCGSGSAETSISLRPNNFLIWA